MKKIRTCSCISGVMLGNVSLPTVTMQAGASESTEIHEIISKVIKNI